MSKPNKKWVVAEADLHQASKLSKALSIPPLLARILVLRGITDPKEATSFLSAPLKDIHDPYLMKGMREAVDRLVTAIQKEEKILVYGDYDVDGITAASLAVHFFREIGVNLDTYVPHRLSEGYGLNEPAIRAIKEKGVSVIITADCGINAVNEVQIASDLGMDVIITDHHQVPEEHLPEALAILNPLQKGCNYPFKSLSGVGVIYKLIIGLRAGLRESGFQKELPNLKKHLDLVALGTIADIVPLNGENHILCRRGLEELSHTQKAGLRALKSVANIMEKPMGSYDVGFVLGPRLNAAGRMGKAERGVQLLASEEMAESLELANQLDKENQNRQETQKEVISEAMAMIKQQVNLNTEYAIILASENWHPGVIGIAASKIVDTYHRPTILIALDGGMGKGSGRSIDRFHIYQALEECSKLFSGFGGHKAAAGLSIEPEKIPVFKSKFFQIAARDLTPDDLIPTLKADAEINLDELDIDLVKRMESMSPFGISNPRPSFVAIGVKPAGELKRMGSEKDHIKFPVKNKRGVWMEVVGFYMGKAFGKVDMKNCTLDILFTPQINEWRGRETLQLKLSDCRIHENSDE